MRCLAFRKRLITLERKERWKKYKEEYEEFFGEEFELELADDRNTGKK